MDIHLNSSEQYIKLFNVKKSYWFPNAYPDELIYPMNIDKNYKDGKSSLLKSMTTFLNHISWHCVRFGNLRIGPMTLRLIHLILNYQVGRTSHDVLNEKCSSSSSLKSLPCQVCQIYPELFHQKKFTNGSPSAVA